MTIFRLSRCAAGVAATLGISCTVWAAPPEIQPAKPKPAAPATQPAQAPAPAVAAPAKEAPAASQQLVIAHLEFREKKVTIKKGAKGPVYEVRSKEGKLLGENLTEKELQARDPELHKLIQTAIGSADKKDGRVLDARVNWPEPVKGPGRPSNGPR